MPLHPPKTISYLALRQGPFLLQPVPRILDGSDGGDATDIVYLSFDPDEEDGEDEGQETDHLGVIMVAYKDGKVDMFLDVEKVEARWETKYVSCSLALSSSRIPDFLPRRATMSYPC